MNSRLATIKSKLENIAAKKPQRLWGLRKCCEVMWERKLKNEALL